MSSRITFIDDSPEYAIFFVGNLPEGTPVEIQPIHFAPYFSDEIEQQIIRFAPHLIVLDLILKKDERSGLRILKKLLQSKGVRKFPIIVCSKAISGKDKGTKLAMRVINGGAKEAWPKVPFPAPEKILDAVKAYSGR